jgi:ribokinase
MVTPRGERTIVVIGQPLHPRRTDALAWEELEHCDAVYFTAEDPDALVACRRARLLIVTARRRNALAGSGVRADVVVGSAHDPREASALADYPVRPDALVMTEGADGGLVERASGRVRFETPVVRAIAGGAYGAGDSFAGALVFYLACGLDPHAAATRAAHHGAAVLGSLNPLDAQLALAPPPAGEV